MFPIHLTKNIRQKPTNSKIAWLIIIFKLVGHYLNLINIISRWWHFGNLLNYDMHLLPSVFFSTQSPKVTAYCKLMNKMTKQHFYFHSSPFLIRRKMKLSLPLERPKITEDRSIMMMAFVVVVVIAVCEVVEEKESRLKCNASYVI